MIMLIGLSVDRDGAECGPFDLHGLILSSSLRTALWLRARQTNSLRCEVPAKRPWFPAMPRLEPVTIATLSPRWNGVVKSDACQAAERANSQPQSASARPSASIATYRLK